jgi:hypothetical protein
MAKKKRKKKHCNSEKDADPPIVVQDHATGISATTLATFTRDLSAFGSRAVKPTRGSAR